MVRQLLTMLFGGGRNIITDTVEVFRPNAEAADQRSAHIQNQAMKQFSQEFGQPGIINSVADGLNRLGRPFITYGVFSMFISAMYNPVWFSTRMQGLSLVPEPLWLILGSIVAFFFGSRELSKFRSKDMAKEAARIAASVPVVIKNVEEIASNSPGVAEASEIQPELSDPNPAIADWHKQKRNT